MHAARRRLSQHTSVIGLILACGCSAAKPGGSDQAAEVPLYGGMGTHHRAVTTRSPMAQRYFDQGLIWAYGFNHDEAIRSFKRAAELDPDCAMAYWGIALCNGPHINNPIVPPERAVAAWDALKKAESLAENASPTERQLIAALGARYANPQPDDRSTLDAAYADAMGDVWRNHADDPDVGMLYAEAMMDLHPWDLWTQDGKPKPGTEAILVVLEKVLELEPHHPGANHLYIHAVEASAHPERANASADRLRNMVPTSGHLTHMPSHIDVLTGRWAQAAEQNERAIESDRAYRKRSPNQGFYHLYMLHNHHMLAFASMMEGRFDVAIRAARQVREGVPDDFLRTNTALADPYMGAVYDVLKRFGKWDEILAEPAPPAILPITTAMWRFHRGLAFAAKGQIRHAEAEQAAFESVAAGIPDNAIMAINPAHKILDIARHMLEGEIAFRRGEIDASVAELRKAIAIEDGLLYMEPPEWVQPVRHTLGAVLLSAGRSEEAEQVYREDLEAWPGNGWSLYGLARCLHARGKMDEAQKFNTEFRQAWSRADTPIGSSCLCVPKT